MTNQYNVESFTASEAAMVTDGVVKQNLDLIHLIVEANLREIFSQIQLIAPRGEYNIEYRLRANNVKLFSNHDRKSTLLELYRYRSHAFLEIQTFLKGKGFNVHDASSKSVGLYAMTSSYVTPDEEKCNTMLISWGVG